MRNVTLKYLSDCVHAKRLNSEVSCRDLFYSKRPPLFIFFFARTESFFLKPMKRTALILLYAINILY